MYLHSKFIAGVAPIHLSARKAKFPLIKGSAVTDAIGDLAKDFLIHSDALHTYS